MGKLSGKVALVSGGSSGIGLASAKLFAQEGALVFITGRRKKELEDAVAEIGHLATWIQADISNLADLDPVYEAFNAEAGVIDILFANAGVGDFAPCAAPLPKNTSIGYFRST